jgi:hypothetical protein
MSIIEKVIEVKPIDHDALQRPGSPVTENVIKIGATGIALTGLSLISGVVGNQAAFWLLKRTPSEVAYHIANCSYKTAVYTGAASLAVMAYGALSLKFPSLQRPLESFRELARPVYAHLPLISVKRSGA